MDEFLEKYDIEDEGARNLIKQMIVEFIKYSAIQSHSILVQQRNMSLTKVVNRCTTEICTGYTLRGKKCKRRSTTGSYCTIHYKTRERQGSILENLEKVRQDKRDIIMSPSARYNRLVKPMKQVPEKDTGDEFVNKLAEMRRLLINSSFIFD